MTSKLAENIERSAKATEGVLALMERQAREERQERIGRNTGPLRRIAASPIGWLLAAGLGHHFRPVEEDCYERHDDRALVACDCGRRFVLSFAELACCESTRAWVPTRRNCQRVYFLGERLHVANSPVL